MVADGFWAMLTLLVAPVPQDAEPRDPMADLQLRLAQHALARCTSLGHAVTVVVADVGGTPRVQLSASSSSAIDVESARRKALTAALTRRRTSVLAEIAGRAPGFGETLKALDSRVLLVGGGVPFASAGRFAGTIAVGGAPGGAADEDCAVSALSAKKLAVTR